MIIFIVHILSFHVSLNFKVSTQSILVINTVVECVQVNQRAIHRRQVMDPGSRLGDRSRSLSLDDILLAELVASVPSTHITEAIARATIFSQAPKYVVE